MSPAQQQLLIDNIVGAMRGIPEAIARRQLVHFRKADQAYGDGVAQGLGLMQVCRTPAE